eukprot:gene2295-2831_t
MNETGTTTISSNNNNNNNEYSFFYNASEYYTNPYRTRDTILGLLVLLILVYTFYRREKKIVQYANTFKQILHFTPTIILLEINFHTCQVKTSIQIKGEGQKKYRFTGKFDIDHSTFSGVVLDISEEESELKKLKYILAHDPLTGLQNRYRLNQKIQKFCNKSSTDLCALFFIDLNKFKTINDTYGHEIGDQVLKHVSNQFQLHKDDSIMPVRLSGDEFLILKRCVENVDQADSFIHQYLEKVSSKPFTTDGDSISPPQVIPIQLSYGGVVFQKSETEVGSIIKSADEKMYQMKRGNQGSQTNVILFNSAGTSNNKL